MPTTIGMDEVGRGALAGPVVVAGISVKGRMKLNPPSFLGPLRDSKKLSPAKREAWYRYIISNPKLSWKIARVYPAAIDRINITKSANLAAFRVLTALAPKDKPYIALLDGGLALPRSIPHRVIIRGDEKLKIISASSILAKVTRDRAMRRLHRKDPRYRFDLHKGYGTKLHLKCIKRFGYSKFHRKSFVISPEFLV